MQMRFFELNASASNNNKIHIRIGIHLADIIEADEDSYGDGVNIAARLEALADLSRNDGQAPRKSSHACVKSHYRYLLPRLLETC